jgi:hypothetical protein
VFESISGVGECVGACTNTLNMQGTTKWNSFNLKRWWRWSQIACLKKPSSILSQIWGKLSLLATFENGFCLKTTAEFDDDLKNNPNYRPDFQNFPVCLNYALKEKLGKNPLCSFIYLFENIFFIKMKLFSKRKSIARPNVWIPFLCKQINEFGAFTKQSTLLRLTSVCTHISMNNKLANKIANKY